MASGAGVRRSAISRSAATTASVAWPEAAVVSSEVSRTIDQACDFWANQFIVSKVADSQTLRSAASPKMMGISDRVIGSKDSPTDAIKASSQPLRARIRGLAR